MKTELQHINVDFTNHFGETKKFPLSYQLFGKPLHSAPIILVNHALTGNSDVAGEKGWWKTLVGNDKIIDTNTFTVICFNVPGNGYDGFLIDDYQNFTTSDIALIFLLGLKKLKINKLFALVGGSIGGSIGWEMLAQSNDLAERFIPIATDHQTTDWLYSQCLVQKFLLESRDQPLEKARIHAMLLYRTPESLNLRFKNEFDADKQVRKSQDWLDYHGKSLNDRFSLKAYRLMNHLLTTINVSDKDILNINSKIHLISVDSDLFFPAFEIKKTYNILTSNHKNTNYYEIQSIHGHDAFLMEYDQLNNILKNIFS